jgi:hypothetical protein
LENPVKVHLTRWDLVAFNLLLTPRLRSTWIVCATIGLILVLLLVVSRGVPTSGVEWLAIAIGAAVGATAFLGVGFLISIVFVLSTSSASNGILGEHTYSFEADGLREQTSANDTLIKWGGARDVRRLGAFVLINISPALYHVIPRRCFASSNEYDEFWAKAQRLKNSLR